MSPLPVTAGSFGDNGGNDDDGDDEGTEGEPSDSGDDEGPADDGNDTPPDDGNDAPDDGPDPVTDGPADDGMNDAADQGTDDTADQGMDDVVEDTGYGETSYGMDEGPPVTGGPCEAYAANTANCFGGDAMTYEETCYDDLDFYDFFYGPACASAWEDLFACIGGVSCMEYEGGLGCDPQVAARDAACV